MSCRTAHFKRVAVLVTAALASPPAVQAAVDLGPAQDYNIFAFNNYTQNGGGVAYRVAAGGATSFTSVGVATTVTSGFGVVTGGNLTTSGGGVYGNTVVGGNGSFSSTSFYASVNIVQNLTSASGGSFTGNFVTGGSFNSSGFTLSSGRLSIGGSADVSNSLNVSGGVDVGGNIRTASPSISGGLRANGSVQVVSGGSVNPGVTYGTTFNGPGYINRTQQTNAAQLLTPTAVPVNFAQARTALQGSSQEWGSLAATGTVTTNGGALNLTGTRTDLNIFQLANSSFWGATSLNISVPTNSAVLITITGTSVTLPNIGWTLNGQSLVSGAADAGAVLFNLPQATTLTLSSIGGSVLAPFADATANSGTINGTLIINNLTSVASINYSAFDGGLPQTAAFTAAGVVPEPGAVTALLAGTALLLRRSRR